MRMRLKGWTEPLLNECPYMIEKPSEQRGTWQRYFAKEAPVYLEIGCGKGVSTVKQAHDNPQINMIAIDEVRHVLAVTIKNAAAEYGCDPIDNLLLSSLDAMFIADSFSSDDNIERIIINFCNPWGERLKHHKRRLTHPRQLVQYRSFLKDGGEIHFKTDDEPLFADSMLYFEACGFDVIYRTDDLHNSGYAPNYISEHEKMYSERGIPIHFAIARKKTLPKDFNFTFEGRSIQITPRGNDRRSLAREKHRIEKEKA